MVAGVKNNAFQQLSSIESWKRLSQLPTLTDNDWLAGTKGIKKPFSQTDFSSKASVCSFSGHEAFPDLYKISFASIRLF